MLIICNGVFKSGSTWLHAIVIEILRIKNINITDVSHKYTNNVEGPTSIVESKLNDFLNNEDYENYYYINKSHYLREDTISRTYPDSVVFVFTHRDIKDSIVSHFFHLKYKYRIISNFSLYYWLIGRFKAFEIVRFNKIYIYYFNKENFFPFSLLKNDFNNTAQRITKVLGLTSLTQDELEIIKEKTSLSNMRNEILRGNTKYYSTVRKSRSSLIRKGIEDDHINYFSAGHLRDINKIHNFNTSYFFKFVYFVSFTLRRKLFNIE